MLLRMLLGCGFRLGEPLAAKVKDINFQSGTILIRHAKNNKQRVIPMDVTLTQMLERYCIAMGIKTEPESYLFPSSKNKGAAVSKGTFDLRFRNLLQETYLYVPGNSPFKSTSAFIVSATILPSIPLRRQNRTDYQRKILCPSCRSILDTMTWMRQKNT
ncbi:MAG: tyrosine-type recombinase/integrase [Lacrimispora saccharolytica]